MVRENVSATLFICLLMLFAAGYVQTTAAYYNPVLEVNVYSYNLTAGDENELSVSIDNIGRSDAYDVKASLTVPSTTSGLSIVNGSHGVFERIRQHAAYDYEKKWMHPVLHVARDCPLGAYSLKLRLEYTDSSDNGYIDDLQVGVVVHAIKPAEVDIAVVVESYYLTAGAESRIEVFLTNRGDTTIHDIDSRLTSTSPQVVVMEETSYTFDVIGVNSSVYFAPLLSVSRSTPLGAYSLTLTLNYKDPDGVPYSDSLTIGVLVNSVEPRERTRIAVQDFKVTPAEVFPGDNLTMEMELKNWGADAHDVQVQLAIDSQSPFVSLDPTLVFVGDLNMNKTAKVIYNLRISGDADANLYDLQLVISYYDVDDQPDSLTEALSIGVQSIVDFRLLDIQPATITAQPGETLIVEADLLLLGTETVDFVEVEIIENTSIGPFIPVPESYEYIGRVDPDSPVVFTIQFAVDPNATVGSYTAQIGVDCWDGYNQQRHVMIELPIVVEEFSDQNNESTPTLWDIIWTVIRILFGVKP